MKRGLALLLLFAAISAGAKEKKPEYVIRWQVNHYPLRYFTETAAKMNELLKESTGGRVAVQAMTNTEDGWLVDIKNALSKIWLRNGDYEMAQIYTFNLVEFEPHLHTFDLPFLFDSHAHFQKVVESPLGESMVARLKNYDLEPLAFTYSGGMIAIAARNPLRKPSDFKGMKYLAWEHPVNLSVHNLLGTKVINSSPYRKKDVYPLTGALLAGAAEGGDCGTNETGEMMGVKNIYYNLINHRMLATVLTVYKPYFDKMPKDLQKAVRKAAIEAARWEREQIAQSEIEQVEKLKKAGKKIVTLTPAEVQKMRTFFQPVYDEYKSLIGANTVEQIRAMAEPDVKKDQVAEH